MANEIERIYQGIMGIIEEAKVLLEDASLPDTDVMKREVEKLCKAINSLPVQQRVAYAGELGMLFDSLSELEEKLKAKRLEVGEMLADAPSRKAATKAYAKTDHIDKKNKKKK